MKKLTLLNREVSRAVADLGHRDLLVLADAGHAIPRGADRIDLALRPGQPPILDVLETVLTELRVEAYVVCREMETENPGLLEAYGGCFPTPNELSSNTRTSGSSSNRPRASSARESVPHSPTSSSGQPGPSGRPSSRR